MKKVYITGSGSCIQESDDLSVLHTRENRKIMRFARASGKLFLAALSEALKNSDCNSFDDGDSYRKGVFFGDFMNLTTDNEHRIELFEQCKKVSGSFDEKVFINYIIDNWSAVEVLKEVPNIPCFLAVQLTGATGPSETLLNSCASGISALKAGFELIRDGKIDIAYIGAGSAKNDDIERKIFNSQGYYNDNDYSIVNAGAALILESEERIIKRKGTPLAIVNSVSEAFAPDMFLRSEFDTLAAEKLIEDLSVENDQCLEYYSGSYSKRYLHDERLAVSRIMPKAVIKEGIKGSSGYSFAASGLLEIAEILRSGNVPDNFIVSSLGYGGYQSAAYISSVNT